jgi:hypothetical protein
MSAATGCICNYAGMKLQETFPATKFTQQKVLKKNEIQICCIKKKS